MSELIADPRYWARRLREAKAYRHHAVFRCPADRWQAIEARHREILARTVGPLESVLDAGCAWGRLLTLMPPHWSGDYLGVDLSPDFLELARKEHPGRPFLCCDLRELPDAVGGYDWAVLVSIRPMIRRHQGDGVWAEVERRLRRAAARLIYLEYDPDDPGSVE